MVNVKLCLHSGIHADEIRRCFIDSASFELLVVKIREVFPTVGDKEFSLQWRDGDDFVTFSSDEELAIALEEVKQGVLYVLVRLASDKRQFDCPYLDKLHHCPYLMKSLCGADQGRSAEEEPQGCPYLEKFQGSGCPYIQNGYCNCPYLACCLGLSSGNRFGTKGKCPFGFGFRKGCPLGFGGRGGYCPLGFGFLGIGNQGGCPLGFGLGGQGYGAMGGLSCPVTRGKRDKNEKA